MFNLRIAAEPLSQTVTYNKYAPACEEWLFLVLHHKKQARVGVLAFGLFEKVLVVFGLIVNCAVVGVVAIACF